MSTPGLSHERCITETLLPRSLILSPRLLHDPEGSRMRDPGKEIGITGMIRGEGGRRTCHSFLTDIMFFALNSSSVELHLVNKQSLQWSSIITRGGVSSWLVHSPPDVAIWVRALPGDIVLCSRARYFTLTVHLPDQVSKWVPATAGFMLGVTLWWTSIPSRGKLKYS